MNDELLEYYKRELSFLREMGAQFRSKYPGVAAHLQLDRGRCDDPHVERLLEGFAFLTARIRAKLDDEFPEVTDALLGMLYPHLQRPFPSATVVQFARRARAETPPGGDRFQAGTALRALHPDWRHCRFRTVYPLTLWPLEVAGVELAVDRFPMAEKRRGEDALLRLTLRCDAPGEALTGMDELRFYLAGEDRVSYAVHELVGAAVTRVELRGLPDLGSSPRIPLKPGCVRLVGFGPDEGLFPYPRRSPRGYRLLQEYLHFPRKFLFFDVTGLEPAAALCASGGFELLLFLDRHPKEALSLRPQDFLLGCTPAVNLFPARAVPIRLSRTRSEYPVIPDVPGRDRAEVYSIDRVVSTGSLLDENVVYHPFYSFRHGDRDRTPPFWYASRRPSSLKGQRGTDVELAFVDPGFDPHAPSTEVATVSLTCTNRDSPVAMPVNQRTGDLEPESSTSGGSVRCLLPMSSPFWPPLGREAQWRLISNLSLNYLSLVDLGPGGTGPEEPDELPTGRDALVELLTAYDYSGDEAVRERINGITAVSARRVLGSTADRAAVGGIEVAVSFDESKYVGASPFLLACVLERFLGLYVSINSFSKLIAVNGRHGVIKRWPPRAGEKPLL